VIENLINVTSKPPNSSVEDVLGYSICSDYLYKSGNLVSSYSGLHNSSV